MKRIDLLTENMSRPPVLVLLRSRMFSMVLVYVVEHEVRVGQGGRIGVKIVARFSHAMACDNAVYKGANEVRGFLLRSFMGNRRRNNLKRIGNEGRPGARGLAGLRVLRMMNNV